MTAPLVEILKQHRLLVDMGARRPIRIGRPPLQAFPSQAEATYRKELAAYIETLIDDVERSLIPRLPELEREAGLRIDHAQAREDALGPVIEALLAELGERSQEEAERAVLRAVIEGTGDAISNFSRLQVFQILKKQIGVDIFASEPQLGDMLGTFTDENIALIKSIPTQFHDRIGRIVRDEFRQGERAEVVKEKILDTFSVTRNRAVVIARDQSNKLNGQLTRMRQTNLGIEKYTWRTSKDDRVRPSHRANEGKVFSWDKPPPRTGHPGQDILCRCTAEPKVDTLL